MPRCSTPCATRTRPARPSPCSAASRCAADACGPDGATVVDAAGTRWRADLVVAADGIHSTLRHALLGDDAPHYSGDDAYRALIDVDAIDPHSPVFEIVKEPQVTIWLGPGRHAIHYWVRERRLLNLVVIVPGDGSTRESWSSKGDRATLEAEPMAGTRASSG